MAETFEILVLVANDQGATLCRNCNGVTDLIQKIACNCQNRAHHCESESVLIGKDRIAPGKFACELINVLEQHAESHCYDSIIILADASIYDDLRRARHSERLHPPIAHFIVPEIAPWLTS